MVDREEHIKLSDEFFDKAIELIQSMIFSSVAAV
jgi:hypothetical protein